MLDRWRNLLVDNITHQRTGNQAHNDRQRHARRRTREAHTGDKHDGLDTLAQHGDERHEEHGVLLAPAGERVALPLLGDGLLLERLGELDAPLLLHLGDAQQGGAEGRDDDRRDETEGAFPVVLGVGPGVAAQAVEGADDAAADDEAEEEAGGGADPDLRGVS